MKKCATLRCNQPATWVRTIVDHPNERGTHSDTYCGEHIKDAVNPWDDAPTLYTIVIEGPFRHGIERIPNIEIQKRVPRNAERKPWGSR